MHAWYLQNKKRVLFFMRLELLTILSHHIDAGNQTWVLRKSCIMPIIVTLYLTFPMTPSSNLSHDSSIFNCWPLFMLFRIYIKNTYKSILLNPFSVVYMYMISGLTSLYQVKSLWLHSGIEWFPLSHQSSCL